MKKLIALCLVILSLFTFASCGIDGDKDFSYKGMTITLTNLYAETETTESTATYISLNNAVVITLEDISTYPQLKDLTLKEYAEAFIEANEQYVTSELTEKDGILSVELTIENGSETYKYYTSFHKNDTGFWNVKFGTLDTEYDDNKDKFIEFAKTVRFE